MTEPLVVVAQGGGWGPPGAGYPGSPPTPGGYGGGGYGGGPAPPGKPITGGKETMAIHAMSIDPSTGLPIGEQPPASTTAVVSLVFGVLLCLPFAGLPAMFMGMLAYFAARRDPKRVGGASMAIVGILLGLLNVLGWGVTAGLWLFSLLI